MADHFTIIRDELNKERNRIDRIERELDVLQEKHRVLEDVVGGNKAYDRKGLVHDLAAVQSFVTEIKEFKGKAVGISLFITAVVVPCGLWALKNMDFIQELFGKK